MRTVSVLLLIVAAGCFRAPPPRYPTAEALVGTMADRLALMDDVARAKWNAKAPVSDIPREKNLLAEMMAASQGTGLDPKDVTAIFAAQIETAKLIQQARFDVWTAKQQGPFPDAPDLARDLRPKIDRASQELLGALASYRAGPPAPAWAIQRIAAKQIADPEVRAAAIKSLIKDDKVTR